MKLAAAAERLRGITIAEKNRYGPAGKGIRLTRDGPPGTGHNAAQGAAVKTFLLVVMSVLLVLVGVVAP